MTGGRAIFWIFGARFGIMAPMNLWLRCLISVSLVPLLGGCVQRTVTNTQSKISFGTGWAEQTGDVDKIRDKWASGFEIKDGMAVATDPKKNLQAKNLTLNTLQSKSFAVTGTSPIPGKTFKTGNFGQTPAFQTSTASESQKAFGTNAAELGNQQVKTGLFGSGQRKYSTKAAREAGDQYTSGKKSAGESSAKATPAHADLVLDQGRLKEDPSSLTEDQVRDLLHPGHR